MAAAEISSVVKLSAFGPRRIGRYEICFELASGGMATVYLARLEGMGGFSKLVAVKRIHPHLVGKESFVEMFLDEARLASRIDHPNVCGVFDFGLSEESYYIAMEFLVGETVARLFGLAHQHPDLSPLPAHAFYAARIVADAAQGLHAAHELRDAEGSLLNVVHRDVSPQNLMVTYDGVVKVMDFGIASAVDQLHHTKTGTVRGKFAYMSPEQLEGRPIDRRADVWSLGVIFWELLTGQHLFSGIGEADAVRAVLGAEIPAPSSKRPGVPREFDDIVRKCLARAPAERWSTAEELASAINAVKTRRAQAVAQAALGAWLKHLFPDLHARRLELVDQARQMSGEHVPRVSRMLSAPDIDTLRIAHAPKVADNSRARRAFVVAAVSVTLVAAFFVGALVAMNRSGPSKHPDADEPSTARGLAPPVAASLPSSRPAGLSPVLRAPLARAARPAPTPPPSSHNVEEIAKPVLASPARSSRSTSRAPSRAQASRTSEAGIVDVATPGGWADVYASGKHQGRTPVRLTLASGRQVVGLRPYGRGRMRRHEVMVRAGALNRLVIPVEPPALQQASPKDTSSVSE